MNLLLLKQLAILSAIAGAILGFVTVFVYFALIYFKDAHPILDSITTVFSTILLKISLSTDFVE